MAYPPESCPCDDAAYKFYMLMPQSHFCVRYKLLVWIIEETEEVGKFYVLRPNIHFCMPISFRDKYRVTIRFSNKYLNLSDTLFSDI